ncbi:MAG: hypothetical protein V7632_4453 [Bradyrhizobium sp.]|jgi:hypothetical protein
METRQPKPRRNRAGIAVAVIAVVASIAAGSAVLAQEQSAKPSTPPAEDKMGMGAGQGGMMDMGSEGKGMMGMTSGMKQMKCCGQGMSHDDHGASKKQDDKK